MLGAAVIGSLAVVATNHLYCLATILEYTCFWPWSR